MTFSDLLKRRYELFILVAFLLLVFILEIRVTFTSPIAFGDEGHHTRLAQYIAENKEYPTHVPTEGTKLMRGNFARPPLWQLTQAGFYTLFGFNEIIVKFITPFIATILTGFATYILVKKLFDDKVGIIASIITVTIPAVVTYAVLFYVDSLFTFYFILFGFLLVLGIKNENVKYLILAGAFAALAFLTKIVGVFVFIIFGLVLLYGIVKVRTNFKQIMKIYVTALLFATIFVSTFLLRNVFYYNTPLCTDLLPLDVSKCDINNFKSEYKFSQAIEQVGTNVSVLRFGIKDYIEFAYGNLWFIVISFVAGIYLLSKKEQGSILFIIIILAFLILFVKLLPSRTEDVARYTLSWSPVIAAISALYFSSLYLLLSKYYKYLCIVIILLVIFFGYTSLTNKLDVMSKVKKFSPLFFEACDWVKNNLPKDIIISTVWGHHTAYNCQRVSAGNLADFQLSNNVDVIASAAKENGITHIFVQKFSLRNQPLQEGYTIDFVALLESNPEKFEKVYENGPDLNSCIAAGGCDGNIIYKIV